MKTKNKTEQPLLFKIIMLFSGVILGLLIMGITIQGLSIQGNSMSPIISEGDFVILNKMSSPKNGDIAAIKSPTEEKKILISRIIAVEFDTIEIKNKNIYINGRKFSPSWESNKSKEILPMKFSYRDNMPPIKLGSNEFFVISDNFDKSYDSRCFGKISEKMIIGKIIYIHKK